MNQPVCVDCIREDHPVVALRWTLIEGTLYCITHAQERTS